MALRETMKAAKRPPKLRRGNARQRCGLCRHFDGKGTCRLYSYSVTPNQLSNSFSSAAHRDGSKEA